MRPPHAAIAVALVGLVVLSGCLGFGGPPPSDPGAEAVVDSTVEASSMVQSYRYSLDVRVVASEGEDTRRISMTADGAVNRTTDTMRADLTYQGTERSTYVTGSTAYTECESPWGWGRENLSSSEEWEAKDTLGRQVDMLDSSPVYWVDNESIDGETVHVVEAHPSRDTLSKYSERRTGGVFGPGIEGARLTAWIVEDSGRLVKTELEFTVSEGGGSADAHMTTRFREHGTDVTITIPEEATENPHTLGCPGG